MTYLRTSAALSPALSAMSELSMAASAVCTSRWLASSTTCEARVRCVQFTLPRQEKVDPPTIRYTHANERNGLTHLLCLVHRGPSEGLLGRDVAVTDQDVQLGILRAHQRRILDGVLLRRQQNHLVADPHSVAP